jgi:hypothetical protein
MATEALRGTPARFEGAGPATAAAHALLAGGVWEGPRDLLRLLARSAARDELPRALIHPLLELAGRFSRWTGDQEYLARYGAGLERAHALGAEPAGARAPALDEAAPIWTVIDGQWNIAPEAPGMLRVAPVPPLSGVMSLGGLRVGPTSLGLRLRRRPDRAVLQVARERGPRIRLFSTLREAGRVTAVSLDGEPLGGSRAVFEVSGDHEVEFLLESEA